MQRTYYVGMVLLPGDRRRCRLYVTVAIRNYGLSFCGVEGPRPSGNCQGGCGQIDMHYKHRDKRHNDSRYPNTVTPDAIEFADGWSGPLWLDFLHNWAMWHMKKAPKQVIDFINTLPITTPAITDWGRPAAPDSGEKFPYFA